VPHAYRYVPVRRLRRPRAWPRYVDGPFLIGAENALTITGRGTVVTGAIERGQVRVADPVGLVGLGATGRLVVTSVETMDITRAGDNAALLLRGAGRHQVRRGQVLAARDHPVPHPRAGVDGHAGAGWLWQRAGNRRPVATTSRERQRSARLLAGQAGGAAELLPGGDVRAGAVEAGEDGVDGAADGGRAGHAVG
jgi:hypothetical protein